MEEKERPRLKVVYAANALRELDEIWDWNEERYGPDHANEYVEFLEDVIDSLAQSPNRGSLLKIHPDLRCLLIQRRQRHHGHLVVYSVGRDRVDILHIFHSAQDWRSNLREELE